MVESLPANAGDTGSSPGLGRSHVPRSSWACEPQLLSLRVWSLFSATREAAIVRGPRTAMKSGPRLPQLEKALTQKRRPNTGKNKKKKDLHLIVSRKSYNQAENSSGLGKLRCGQRWIELRLRMKMGKKKLRKSKLKVKLSKLEKQNSVPKLTESGERKSRHLARDRNGPEIPRQIAFIKSMPVFVYQLYLNKAILKSDGGHAVNESKVPS